MEKVASTNWLMAPQLMAEQDEKLTAAIGREQGRLRNFIRRRVPDESDAEDILQDVFYELVEAYRFTKPIEQVGAWLYRVARNRIVDRFRKKKPEPFSEVERGLGSEEGESLSLEEFLPSPDGGPEAAYAREVLLEELEAALDELPEEQREVFLAHEIEGFSFKEISAETGVGISALLSRKHYAVVHLRRRLRAIYDEFVNK